MKLKSSLWLIAEVALNGIGLALVWPGLLAFQAAERCAANKEVARDEPPHPPSDPAVKLYRRAEKLRKREEKMRALGKG